MTSKELTEIRELSLIAKRLASHDLPMLLLMLCNALELEQRTRAAERIEHMTLLRELQADAITLGGTFNEATRTGMRLAMLARIEHTLGDPP